MQLKQKYSPEIFRRVLYCLIGFSLEANGRKHHGENQKDRNNSDPDTPGSLRSLLLGLLPIFFLFDLVGSDLCFAFLISHLILLIDWGLARELLRICSLLLPLSAQQFQLIEFSFQTLVLLSRGGVLQTSMTHDGTASALRANGYPSNKNRSL